MSNLRGQGNKKNLGRRKLGHSITSFGKEKKSRRKLETARLNSRDEEDEFYYGSKLNFGGFAGGRPFGQEAQKVTDLVITNYYIGSGSTRAAEDQRPSFTTLVQVICWQDFDSIDGDRNPLHNRKGMSPVFLLLLFTYSMNAPLLSAIDYWIVSPLRIMI